MGISKEMIQMLPGLLDWDFVNPFQQYFFDIAVLHISRVVNRSLAGCVYYSLNRTIHGIEIQLFCYIIYSHVMGSENG